MPLISRITIAVAGFSILIAVSLLEIMKRRVLRSEIVPPEYRLALNYPRHYKAIFEADWLYIGHLSFGVVACIATIVWLVFAALRVI